MTEDIPALLERLANAKTRPEIKECLRICLEITNSRRKNRWLAIGEAIIAAINPAFLGVLSKAEKEKHFLDIFLRGPTADTIPLLISWLDDEETRKNAYKTIEILKILDAVIAKNVTGLLVDICASNNEFTTYDEDCQQLLIQTLTALPDKVSAALRRPITTESILHPDNYSKTLAIGILRTLDAMHVRLSNQSGDCRLSFLSKLISKLYLQGYGRSTTRVLVPALYARSSSDFLSRRLSQRLVTGVQSNVLEAVVADVVLLLAENCDDHRRRVVDLRRVLGDAIDTDEQVRYLLTNKLLLQRRLDVAVLPETLFAYLCTSTERQKLLSETVSRLLTVWAAPASIVRANFDEHFRLSRSIVVGISRMDNENLREVNAICTSLVLRGVSAHLNLVDERLRKLGMVMAEILTRKLMMESDDAPKLQFQYEDDEYTTALKEAAEQPVVEEADEELYLEVAIDKLSMEAQIKQEILSETENTGTGLTNRIECDVDSDDDLVPYDLPDEKEQLEGAKETLPVYLRDCLEVLIDQQSSFTKTETSLRLIQKQMDSAAPGADDIALEITRILLHMEDRFNMPDFHELQLAAMISCCVRQPKFVAVYLAGEFYARNFSIHHRLLMLDTLIGSAKRLANSDQTSTDAAAAAAAADQIDQIPIPTPIVPSWRLVIEERLKAKTRRKGEQNRRAIPPKAIRNRLAPVANCFFYPLLTAYDRRIDTLDLFGADFLLLGRLLFATGSILYETGGVLGSSAMAASLLQLIDRGKRHQQAYVRQGSLFALLMVLLTVPPRVLATDLQEQMTEAKFWLDQLIQDEPDDQCRQLAAQASSILAAKLNDGLNSVVEIGLVRSS